MYDVEPPHIYNEGSRNENVVQKWTMRDKTSCYKNGRKQGESEENKVYRLASFLVTSQYPGSSGDARSGS